MHSYIKTEIPGFVSFLHGVYPGIPIALTSIVKGLNISPIESEGELRKVFLELLFEAVKQGMKIKVVYDCSDDYYFYYYLDDKDINVTFDNVFIEYIKKYKEDPYLWAPATDVTLKPKPKLIKLMERAIKRNRAIDDNDEIYDNAWNHKSPHLDDLD